MIKYIITFTAIILVILVSSMILYAVAEKRIKKHSEELMRQIFEEDEEFFKK